MSWKQNEAYLFSLTGTGSGEKDEKRYFLCWKKNIRGRAVPCRVLFSFPSFFPAMKALRARTIITRNVIW
uniref:Uncharacterized protein n=1 Tax=Caenorhabditis japonica TaxID=281687 RepID=A0A8R1IC41_CAEJA